ncbi:tetratricopeptide repeat protein [Cytobacillus sp. NCCP-133]|uniref:tetratricopeptide repeat protein n=1 Tax=Cytobacillus sp. NCCP-133 TaxID=766848 RepID=UPI002232A8A6|nr:tetratricopeptide repeat protein [Cytobacillus sp. NCCP-133]GLB58406.1 hypothetical protein NCCP133_05390 [Cytobacillus sp. NCCP-133]
MDKREQKKQNNKIILFPGVAERLMEKGLESFQQNKYQESICFFEEAMEIEPDHTDIHIGLVLAYFEAGNLQKAKELANKMLQSGIGDYIQVMDLYLMILVQLHQYNEIVATVEVLLEEREIPKEKFDHFSRMLAFCRRMERTSPEKQEREAIPVEENKNKKLNLFSYQDQNAQMMLAAQLAEQNIRPYIDDIKAYLVSEQGHPFFKTMLLNVMSEHEYDKEVVLEKFGKSLSLNPSDLPPVHQQPKLSAIVSQLAAQLEQEDPILYENIKGLIERQFFLVYPLELEPFNAASWAAAYHRLASEYHGLEASSGKMAKLYGISEEELEEALSCIRKIEEISYPNI